MHIRVLLSKYRSYTPCGTCGGARLKTESLLWRIGSKEDADAVMEPVAALHARRGEPGPAPSWKTCPGLCLHDLMLLPLDRLRRFFESMNQTPKVVANEGETQALEAALRGNHHPAQVPVRRRHRLPHAGSPEPHAQRRRSAAHQPDHRVGHLAGQHLVRARRAQHRPASARHAPHHQGHAAPARRRQHAGGGGARPGRDAGRRPHDRHGPRPRRARRADRVRRHDRGAAQRRHADRRLPGRTQAGRHGLQAHGDRPHAAPHPGRRARAQPAERHGRDPAAAPGVCHRRQRLGQVQPDPGRAGPGPDAPLRQGHRDARCTRPPARRGPSVRGRVRGPVTHRQDRALQPGELCGRVGCRARDLRHRAAVAPARLHRQQVQFQQRRRALPDLRRLRASSMWRCNS